MNLSHIYFRVVDCPTVLKGKPGKDKRILNHTYCLKNAKYL